MLASKLFGPAWTEKYDDVEITGIAYDSRKVQSGFAFICIKGYEQDGHAYATKAEEAGAAVIVCEDDVKVNIPTWRVASSRRALGSLACVFYGHPSAEFKLIGITGTNGKTTTTYLIKSILESIGKCVGVIGTNQNIIGEKQLVTTTTTPTTPASLELQQMFSEMAEGGADYVVMEVSSHALELDRVYGCNFNVGVFTNLTQDHLDFHKTMENYMMAKAKLFAVSETGAINIDDDYGKRMMEMEPDCPKLSFGIETDADLVATDIDITARGTKFKLKYNGEEYDANIRIPGKFSVYNALSAIAATIQCGVSVNDAVVGIGKASGVLGRVEVVPTDTDYTVIIDYAHTPDGLENIIKAVKEFAKGRVITLFGCGGDRDNTKRAIMGEIAGRLSDFSIITSDNPRTEDANKIVEMIEAGMKRTTGEYTVIVNRREAIAWALNNARKDDVIILAGKGQETYQIIGKEKHDFDERVIVFNELNKKK